MMTGLERNWRMNIFSRCSTGVWRAWFVPTLVATILLTHVGCNQRPALERKSWMVMSTFANVTVPRAEEAQLPALSAKAEAVLKDVEQTLSLFRPDSELARLNQQAGLSPLRVSGMTRSVLELSVHFSETSQGAFDPTVTPLLRLWGFHSKKAPLTIPSENDIERTKALVGIRHLKLDGDTAFLDQAGMSVDLGGIAKGCAVDLAYDALVDAGGRNFMVNLGGNIRCYGAPKAGASWRIGIQDPFHPKNLVGTIRLPSGRATATSGNYERFVTIQGKRYAHILDPRTGWPVQGMASTTVIAPTAGEADALSTASFVLGVDATLKMLEQMPDCHVVFIPDSQPLRLILTPGFKDFFEPEKGIPMEILASPKPARQVGAIKLAAP